MCGPECKASPRYRPGMDKLTRRQLVAASVASGIAAAASPVAAAGGSPAAPAAPAADRPFALAEATIADLQDGMKSGKWTARSIAEAYLARIDAVDARGPALRSVIELNPDALAIADALDQERRRRARAARSTASRSSSRTTSTPPTGWPRRPGRSRSSGRSRRGCLRRAPAARRRRGDPREDEPERVGEHPVVDLHERLERRAAGSRGTPTPSTATHAARAPARASPSPPISAPSPSGPRPTARSSARPRRTASSASSRPSGS